MINFAVAIGVIQLAVLVHGFDNKIESMLSGVDPLILIERSSGMGHGRDHQAVPVGEYLVVPARVDSFFTFYE